MLKTTQKDDFKSVNIEMSEEIGFVTEVSGRDTIILCDLNALNKVRDEGDSTRLPAGQIGAIVKIKVNK